MDPTFWMMFEENIESIKLIQQYPTGCSNRSNMLPEERIEPIKPIKLIPQYPTGCLNGCNILFDVWREDWTNQTHPTISNRVFKWIQHFEWCLKRRLNQSNSFNNIQQGVQMDPTFWMMFEEKIEPIKLIQQYPTECSNGSNILDDVWREDIQQYPTGCSNGSNILDDVWREDLHQSNLPNNIQQGVQTDPTFCMMFEENIKQIRLIQQYLTGCSNESNILNDVWREYWINQTHPTISNRMFKQIQHVAGREDWTNQTNQTHPTISNRVLKRIQHFGWCLKRGLN